MTSELTPIPPEDPQLSLFEDLEVIKKPQPPVSRENPIRSAIRSAFSSVRTAVDPDLRAYIRLRETRKDYNPVRAYSYSEAVELRLIEPPGPSELDMILDTARPDKLIEE
jgi:hypothetical protein